MHLYGGFPVGTPMGLSAEEMPLIQVVGEGRLDVPPDSVVISLGVSRRSEQAAAAFEQMGAVLGQIVQALLQLGIPREQLQTGQISLQPVYEKDRQVGYEAVATLRVTLTDLSRAGAAIDRAVAAGANTVLGVDFEVRERGAAEGRALTLAVQNAQQNAAVLARSLGVNLGPVWRASEEGAAPLFGEAATRAAVTAGIAVLPGTLPVVRRVRVEYVVR